MLRYLTLLLCALAFSSCTIVDLGGAVDNVGREIPVCKDRALWFKKHSRTTYPLYTSKDGKRYIKLQAYYLPARAKWFNCYMVGGCPVEAHERFYASLRYAQPQTYYAQIEGERPYMVKRLIPAAEFSTANAAESQIKFSEHAAQHALCAVRPTRYAHCGESPRGAAMMRNPRPEEQLRGGNKPWKRKFEGKSRLYEQKLHIRPDGWTRLQRVPKSDTSSRIHKVDADGAGGK